MLPNKLRLALCTLAVAVAVSLGIPAAASAYVVPLSVPELAELSDVIAEVQVRTADARPERAGGRVVNIDTDIDLQVTRVYKGRDRGSLAFTQPGGQADGYTLAVSDLPEFEPGERAIVFLDGNGVVGGWQGKLDIVDGRVPALGLSLAEARRAIRDIATTGSTDVALPGGSRVASGEVADGAAAGDAGIASGTWVTLLNATFENGSTSGWTMSGDPTWAASTRRASDSSWALYGSGGGSLGRAAPGPSPEAVYALATRSTSIDLRGYTRAWLHWDVWTGLTQSTGNWMNVQVATSSDGPWYTPQGTFAQASSAGWRSFALDLSCVVDQFGVGSVDLTGEPTVWVRLAYRHTTGTSDEGVYVDNVRLTASSDPVPVVSSMSPAFVPAGVGRTVTFTGTGFGSTPGSVDFLRGDSQSGQRVAADRIVSWTDTRIEVEVPRYAQPGPVRVIDATGASSRGHFYETGFSASGYSWRPDAFPVSFRVNENSRSTSGERAAITGALQSWSAAGSPLRFAYGGTTTASAYQPARDGRNDIYFSRSTMPAGVVAQAFIWLDLEGYVVESDIVFADVSYTFTVGAREGAFDIESVALHELGHSVGLDDQYGALGRAMGAIPSNATRRALSPHEVLGAVHVYGAEPGFTPPDPADHPVYDPYAPVGGGSSSSSGSLRVEPIAGSNRYATAVQVSRAAFPKGLDTSGRRTVVIATGQNWPDALGGSSLAGAVGGPILLVEPGRLPAEVRSEIRRLGARNAIIIGGKAAVGDAVERELRSLLAGDVRRIAGSNRYQTADAVAREVIRVRGSAYDGTVIVATGGNYPDALAVSPLAAAKAWPLFLAEPGRGLSAGTRSAMGTPKRVLLLGGTGAVSSAVQSDLSRRFPRAEVRRLEGRDRYGTAVAVANYGSRSAGLKWDGVAIATGENFPDALAGGVLQGRRGAVMMLTGSTRICPTALGSLAQRKSEIGHVTYLGGTGAVCPTVRTTVNRAVE